MTAHTVSALRRTIGAELAAAGVHHPDTDAELLIGHVLGLSRGEVQVKVALDAALVADAVEEIRALARRRASREPLQHITGRAPFRALNLRVGPGVFVPRPETEQVAQLAIDALRGMPGSPRAVDLGTGSGAIALALATEVPHAEVHAVEKSPDAYPWTTLNFAEVDAPNATLHRGDLADALPEFGGAVDLVISNPPYIPAAAIPRDPEVHLFDPEMALYGGEDGLDVVRLLSLSAKRLLRAEGLLVIEHGEQQAEAIAALLRSDGWTQVSGHTDLTGRDRATTAIR